MNNQKIVTEFTAAVRGYHVYRSYWVPQEKQQLLCYHEKDNPFDRFAIKVCVSNEKTVGHLPMEIYRPTKFFLDRGATASATLSSTHYRRSPIVKGGLEIKCIVRVEIPYGTINQEITKKYIEIINKNYCEPKEEVILGSFVENIVELELPSTAATSSARPIFEKETHKKCENSNNRDMQTFFPNANVDDVVDMRIDPIIIIDD